MGRPSGHPGNAQGAKMWLSKVRLDSGGYDSGGAYWGHGAQLWRATTPDGDDFFERASTREAAKVLLRCRISEDITFFR